MSELINWPPSWSTFLLLPALFVGFTVHELAHAVVAYLLGDSSQVERKRLSFNPLRHVSWVGMVVFLLFGFGWAKPVWVDHTRFRIKNRAFGVFLVSISGAAANFLAGFLALVGMGSTVIVVWTMTGASLLDVIEFLSPTDLGLDAQGVAVALSYYMVTVNLLLAFFNLLPFPPLDGFQAAVSLFTAIRSALRREPGVAVAAGTGAPARGTVEQAAGDLAERSPAQIHFDIGLEYQQEGQVDEAIARYRQATSHDEQFALAYYNLGLAYWSKGRIPQAVGAFRAALRSDGDPDVRIQAERRLRELARAERNAGAAAEPVPPPLEPGQAAREDRIEPPALDPAAVRRVWLSLGVGTVASVILAVSIWLYVTAVALMAMV
jgi:Zn-dependent protease